MPEQRTVQDLDTASTSMDVTGPGGAGAACAAPARNGRRTGVLTPRAAFYLLASIVVSFLAASSAPTPLYAVYQAEWGFGPVTTTLVFGVYAIAVLASLLTLGRLSDHLGRRPVLLGALAVQAAAMVVFATAHGVPELMIGRVVQGLSTGAALGAVGAGMMDIDWRRGTVANSFAPGLGTATGSLVSAFLVQYLPAPTHLVYLALVGVFALQALGVALMRETLTRTPGALATLVPDVRLPRTVRRAVLNTAPVMIAVWALAGFYGSLGPALVRSLTHSASAVYGGLALFVLAGVAAAATLVLRSAPARGVMLTGIGTLIAGVALTLVAVEDGSPVLFFLGSAIAGIGFGSGFQGGIRTVMPLTAAHERAGVLSLLYVLSYLGLGVPSVIAGYLVVHAGGLVATAREYGAAVMVLALLALIGLLTERRGSRSRPGIA
ncbi:MULTISPECIES: MFS transporter [unclassified Streptomyces]|uniref:MFS transporter n=1 Tax=unclassified Streptomyces TaxID=2593676 RepID=UPI00037A8866|nr:MULTISPECIES: MFS transporter [unclassified Streptomyces]